VVPLAPGASAPPTEIIDLRPEPIDLRTEGERPPEPDVRIDVAPAPAPEPQPEPEIDGDSIQVHTASGAAVAPPPPKPAAPDLTPTIVDATGRDEPPVVIDATETIDATGRDGDEWWVPVVSEAAGSSRATRPVHEDLSQRRHRAEQLAAETTSATMRCDVHRNVQTTLHCARCALPFCDHCLALLGEPSALHCVDCALELSGVRPRGDAGA
jgi:hypothetical protein